jgi:hypothetical protein
LRGEYVGIVAAVPTDVQDGNADASEHFVDERVALAAVGAHIRGVVKLNRGGMGNAR